MKNQLPLKYKKEIINFTREYEQLASSRKIRIVIPRKEIVVDIAWQENSCISIDEDSIQRSLGSEDMYESQEINKINNEIKIFIKKTQVFGRKHFKCADWIWEVIFWDFRPERGERFDFKNIEWVEDYNYKE